MVGTEVPGWRCRINEEELLGPSDGSYHFPNSQPRGPVKSLHIDLLKDLTRDRSLQEVLGILVGALTLQLQGLELGQEVINSLAGALMKMQGWDLAHSLLFPGRKKASISACSAAQVGHAPAAMHSLRRTCAKQPARGPSRRE